MFTLSPVTGSRSSTRTVTQETVRENMVENANTGWGVGMVSGDR